MKKILMIVFCVSLIMGCQNNKESGNASSTNNVKQITDGIFMGEASSYNGEIIVEIEVNNGVLEKINLVKNDDTEAITSRAFPIVEENIIKYQNPNVDFVSSATFSSNAYKMAIKNAMEEAGFDVSSTPDLEIIKYEDTNATLVIVGGGPSGLTAAIEAKENGVENIILIEKEDILGGNGKFDEFFFDFPNTQAQKDAGISDSKEEYKELLKSYEGFETEEMLQKRVDEVWEFDKWLREHEIEANYVENDRNHTHSDSEEIGAYTQDRLESLAKELEIDIRTSTKMTDLIMDGNKVTGIECEYNGQPYKIMADRILVATGGFSSNKDLVKKYIPQASEYISSNTIGQTGDMIEIALKHDIMLSNMDVPQLFNLVITPTRYQFEAKTYGAIIVNKNGERFVNEQDYYSFEFGDAILAQEGGVGYFIYDNEKLNERTDGMGMGDYNKSSSLEELAEKLDINYENLISSIEEYQEIAAGKKEDKFGIEIDGMNVISLDSEYYYGAKIVPSIHMTYGGVQTDTKMRVLNNSGDIVENLYASGEVTASTGIYLESLVFGRLAGQEIAESLK